jgi:hypothetical protein
MEVECQQVRLQSDAIYFVAYDADSSFDIANIVYDERKFGREGLQHLRLAADPQVT